MDFTNARHPLQQAKALITFLKQRNCSASANTLPRQAEYQGLKLLGIQLHFAALSNACPV
ncbi:MAG: hypothetical protein WCA48_27025 [Pseudomonas gingeri]